MGIIFSRFRKKSASEQLENIEEEIRELEACNADTKLRHQKIIKQLTLYSSGLCVLFAIVLYFYIPPKLQTKIILIALLLLSPLIYIINKLISWYYKRKITSSHTRLKDLKKEKKRLLDEIMDKETYKVAKEILEKYAPETLPKYSPRFNVGLSTAGEGFAQNRVANMSLAGVMRSQPKAINNQANAPRLNARFQNQPVQGPLALPAPGMRQGMGFIERFFEYLIGDGPSSRYALICSNCSTHNGMALQEEFEYIEFKCYACFMLNPARKQRPVAPKLEDVKYDRDTLEPDSCSSSVSGDNSAVRIEEIECDANEREVEGDAYSTTSGKVEKPDSQDADIARRMSNAEEDVMMESQNEEQFEILQSSNLEDVEENVKNDGGSVNEMENGEKT